MIFIPTITSNYSDLNQNLKSQATNALSLKNTKASILFGLSIICLLCLVVVASKTPYFKPMAVTQNDIIGEYVIDREKFSGKQADWQYENFRFKVTAENQLIFQSKTHDGNWNSDTIQISYTSGYFESDKNEYCNKKIIVHSDSTTHHIVCLLYTSDAADD